MKVELGGGETPRGEGFVNVDRLPCADVEFDFDRLPAERLPFADDSVHEVYSSHCFEHLRDYKPLLHEISRICRLGATVEIRVPHWMSSMAMCYDHKHTISEVQVDHWCKSHVAFWWGNLPKRLAHCGTRLKPSGNFEEIRQAFPHATHSQILRFMPDACEEYQFDFVVIENR